MGRSPKRESFRSPVKRARAFISARVGTRNLLCGLRGSRGGQYRRNAKQGCRHDRKTLECSGADPSGPIPTPPREKPTRVSGTPVVRELKRTLAHSRTTRDDNFGGIV